MWFSWPPALFRSLYLLRVSSATSMVEMNKFRSHAASEKVYSCWLEQNLGNSARSRLEGTSQLTHSFRPPGYIKKKMRHGKIYSYPNHLMLPFFVQQDIGICTQKYCCINVQLSGFATWGLKFKWAFLFCPPGLPRVPVQRIVEPGTESWY